MEFNDAICMRVEFKRKKKRENLVLFSQEISILDLNCLQLVLISTTFVVVVYCLLFCYLSFGSKSVFV